MAQGCSDLTRGSLIVYKTGIRGWVKFWLMPELGYHFWAQLNGTVHCDYPLLTFFCFLNRIEILFHDINVHIPHHISPRIPSYNLGGQHEPPFGSYVPHDNVNYPYNLPIPSFNMTCSEVHDALVLCFISSHIKQISTHVHP
ncbi:putative acyl-CoA (9+3)-desaturase [Rosa chinensis]|uniref:Putative acyl-CoA (9+3)-desaturase n=1 Tax=Rosa chinensis TaxID=74649 RepID=A0A2P6RHM6_ROSCH|nr:putative acyl-CoA (9+3)-desaturase [Rosa chinensis]